MAYKIKTCLRCGRVYQSTGAVQKWCATCGRLEKLARTTANHIKNLEKEKAQCAAHRAACPEIIHASAAKFRAAHPEKIKEWHSVYKKDHPEKSLLYNEKRRALKYGNTPINELLTEAQWRDILDMHHHRCAYCGRKFDNLTVDHVVPLIKGGKHSASNVVPACQHCNSSKGTKTTEERFGMALK